MSTCSSGETRDGQVHDYICSIFLDILAMCYRKIKPLFVNILSTGDEIVGAVDILC